MKAALASLMLLAPVVGGVAAPAFAQDVQLIRPNIPAQAKRLVVDADNGVLSVKGEVLRLSPAIQIRDAQNRLKLSQSLSGRFKAAVLFDPNGAATRIWLLAAAN